jgi:predicted nucleic-acid-binding Zn-ribbon protein
MIEVKCPKCGSKEVINTGNLMKENKDINVKIGAVIVQHL